MMHPIPEYHRMDAARKLKIKKESTKISKMRNITRENYTGLQK